MWHVKVPRGGRHVETSRKAQTKASQAFGAGVGPPPATLRGTTLPCPGAVPHGAQPDGQGVGMGLDGAETWERTVRFCSSTRTYRCPPRQQAFLALPGSCCERPGRDTHTMARREGRTVREGRESQWDRVLIASKCPEEGPLLSI